MKPTIPLVACVIVALVAFACKQKDGNYSPLSGVDPNAVTPTGNVCRVPPSENVPMKRSVTKRGDTSSHQSKLHIRLVYSEPNQHTICGAFYVMAKGYQDKTDMIGTAADCVTELSGRGNLKERKKEHFWVIFFSSQMNRNAPHETVEQGEKRLRIAEIFVHDAYKGDVTKDNVAVVRLNETVDVEDLGLFFRPVEGTPGLCVTVGWPCVSGGYTATASGSTQQITSGSKNKKKKKQKQQNPSSSSGQATVSQTVPLQELQMTILEGQNSDREDLIFAKATASKSKPDHVGNVLDNSRGASLMCGTDGSLAIYALLVSSQQEKDKSWTTTFMRYSNYAVWFEGIANTKSKVDQQPVTEPDTQAGDDKDDDYLQRPPFYDETDVVNPGPDYAIFPDDTTLYGMAWAIWNADKKYRAKMGIDFTISWGPKIESREVPLEDPKPEDWPPKFFTNVKLDKLLKYPINKATWDFLEAHEGEDTKLQEKRANELFDEIAKSNPFQALRKTLMENGLKLAEHPEKFKQVTQTLLIGHSVTIGGTEITAFLKHYCIGGTSVDLEKTSVGIHNWLCLYFQQYKERLHYVGQLHERHNLLPTLRYKVRDDWKSEGSFFLGPTLAFDASMMLLSYFTRYKRLANFFLPDCTPIVIVASDFHSRQGEKFLINTFPGPFAPDKDKDICPNYAKTIHPNEMELYGMGWKLWEADKNSRAVIDTDFKIELGDRFKYNEWKKNPQKYSGNSHILFTRVDLENVFQRSATYRALWELLIAYDREQRQNNEITWKEKAFFDEVKKSTPYKELKKILAKAKYAVAQWDNIDYDKYMETLWIKQYQVDGDTQTLSHCERHFFGERAIRKRNTLFGLNNWLSIYYRESQGDEKLKCFGWNDKDYKLFPNIQFKVGDDWKDLTPVLMGPAPEFEIVLITLSLFTRRDGNALFRLGDDQSILIYVEASQYSVYGELCLLKGFIRRYKPGKAKKPN